MANSEHSMIGRRLGRFALVERLGAGGMGVVYRARDTELARDVAIKVLPEERVASDASRARFLREARAAASVHHPGIATIFEVGEDSGIVYLAMELVEGEPLGAHMAAGPMPIGEVLRVAIEIGEALAHAHAAGVVHRDIKPDNVMLDPKGKVKILDFGIAKSFGPPTGAEQDATLEDLFATGEGRIVGTPAYMSPEQARAARVDHRSDLFSLGVVVYEMLTGRLPFEGEGPMLLLAAIAQEPHAPLERPDVPAGLAGIVERLLAKRPDDRFESAEELVAALERERRAHVGSAPTMEAPKSSSDRGRGRAVGLGLAALGAIGVIGAVAWQLSTRPSASPPERPDEHSAPSAPEVEAELTERRITANPPELWVMAALPIDSGRGLVYQDESGVHRMTSMDSEPQPIELPEGTTGALRHVLADGRLLFGPHGDDPGPLVLVDGDRARELPLQVIVAVVSRDDRLVAYTDPRGVWVADLDGAEARRLVPVASGEDVDQLAFSPDGTRLAIVRVSRRADDVTGAVEVIDLERGDVARAYSGARVLQTGGMAGLAWRDARRLLVPLFGDPGRAAEVILHEITVDERGASEPRPLHTFAGAAGVTDLQPTAAGLYFTKLQAQADVQWARIEEDGSLGEAHRLTASDRNDRPGGLDPAGRVLFMSDRRGTWDLFAQALDTLRADQLTSGPAQDTYPQVAPDGSLLFFRLETDAAGAIRGTHVMRSTSAGAEPTALFEISVEPRLRASGRPPPEAARLRCGPTGCFVSTLAGLHMRIERFDPASGERTAMVRLDAPEGLYDWDLSPDAQTLAFVHATNEVVLVPIADPSSRRILRVAESGRLMSVAWSPDGRWLAVTGVHVGDDRYVILGVGLEGDTRVLRRSTSAYYAHPSFGADGRTLIYGQQNYDVDVWRLEGLAR